MKWKKVAIVCLGVVALTSQAQVHLCKDSAGKTIFSDSPCAANQTGGQIQRERSHDEITQEREQAFDAENRKQDRRSAEQEREIAQREHGLRVQEVQARTQQPGTDWQSRKDRENAATSAASITKNGGRWDERARAERAAESRRPVIIVRCEPQSCFDDRGFSYRRIGSNQLVAPNGSSCSLTGKNWDCD